MILNKLSIVCAFIFISGCIAKPQISSTVTLYQLSEQDLKSLKEKSLSGNYKSGFQIANFYSNVKNDHKEAMFWYRLSAEQGNKDSASALAYYYSEVFNEPEKAIYWYEFVGSYKLDYVSYNLGRLYEAKGLLDKAASYYCQSYANKGEFKPSKNLSDIYLNQKKLIEALAWRIIYESELSDGSVAWLENNEWLSNMQKSMSQADVEKARVLADVKKLCKIK